MGEVKRGKPSKFCSKLNRRENHVHTHVHPPCPRLALHPKTTAHQACTSSLNCPVSLMAIAAASLRSYCSCAREKGNERKAQDKERGG